MLAKVGGSPGKNPLEHIVVWAKILHDLCTNFSRPPLSLLTPNGVVCSCVCDGTEFFFLNCRQEEAVSPGGQTM